MICTVITFSFLVLQTFFRDIERDFDKYSTTHTNHTKSLNTPLIGCVRERVKGKREKDYELFLSYICK